MVNVYRYENNSWNEKNIVSLPNGSWWYMGHMITMSSDGNIIAFSTIMSDPGTWVWNNGWNWISYGNDIGELYVYEWNGTSYNNKSSHGNIMGEARYDYLGGSIQLSHDGKSIIVASSRNDDGGNNKGSVRVYKCCLLYTSPSPRD